MRGDSIFARNDQMRRLSRIQSLIALLNDGETARLRSCHSMMQPLGNISVTACSQFARFPTSFQLHAALDHKNETLCGRVAQFAANFELSRVLRELGSQSRADVHNRGTFAHSR